MRRTFFACLTCLFAIAAIALAWIPVHSAPPAGPALQGPLPTEGWTVCEVGGLEYIQEVNEVRQVFKLCNADGWEIKAFCTQPGIPAPDGGTGCSLDADGNYWCGGSVQVLRFFAILQEPAATDTPTPTETSTPTDTPTPADTATPTDTPPPTDTATPTGTSIPTDTPTPTGTIIPADTSTVTPVDTGTPTVTKTSTQASSFIVYTVSPPNPPANPYRPYPGGPGNRTSVILTLVAMSLSWGIIIWAAVLRRRSGRT